MNRIEQVLSDDLVRTMDRLSQSLPEGMVDVTGTLRTRLAELDARLAAERLRLLDDYARWTRALDDLENLWALALWRSRVDDAPAAVVSTPRAA
jgi:hypothetical protein